MKTKIIIILALSFTLLLSLSVSTLSNYTSVSSFGTNIYPDMQQIESE